MPPEILMMTDVKPKMITLAWVPVSGNGPVLGRINANDHDRYAKVIKEFSVQAEF
jgi:hypothetical protein